MNGRITPFENGPDVDESAGLRPATVVDVTYDEPARSTGLRSGPAGGAAPRGPAGGVAPRANAAVAHAPRAGAVNATVQWDEESDTQVMGPHHIGPAQPTGGAALELDWDNDDSNTEKWAPKHAPTARKVPERSTSGIRPAVQPTAPTSPEDVIEELREQLIEVLERARTSEARAVAAIRRADEGEQARTAMGALRNQLSMTIERARSSEAAREAAERSAEESEQEAQDALQRLSEQLMQANEQLEAGAAQVNEAIHHASLAEQTVQHARAERQLVEETMARALRRASGRSTLLFCLSVVLLLGCAAAGYFLLYAPLQQRMTAQLALHTQESGQKAQELSSLQARFDSERQEFEATRQTLTAQLAAAGSTSSGAPSAEATAATPASSRAEKQAAARAEKAERAETARAEKAARAEAAHAARAEKAGHAETARADKASAEFKETKAAERASRRAHHGKAAADDDGAGDEPAHEHAAAADKPSSAPTSRDNDPLEGL